MPQPARETDEAWSVAVEQVVHWASNGLKPYSCLQAIDDRRFRWVTVDKLNWGFVATQLAAWWMVNGGKQ